MGRKLRKLATLIGVIYLAQVSTYANAMTLHYDGKSHIYDKESISLYVNEELIEPSIMPPVQIEGYVLVPTRELFNALGATVQWKSVEKKVYIESDDTLIVLELSSHEAWVNGEIKVMDIGPKMINDKLMLPIRFISEILGYKVDWLGVERSIYINQQEMNTSPSIDDNIIEDNKDDNHIDDDYIEEETVIYELNEQLKYLNYDVLTQTMILDKELMINARDITIEDIYLERKIIFNINDYNLSPIIEGTWQGTLGYLKSVTITKTLVGIQIIVETNTVCATDISEENGEVYIRFMKPKEKYNKIIMLDPGHGGYDNGTRYNEILEKDLTLSYGTMLYNRLLEDPSIKVYATRLADIYATEINEIIGKQYPTLDMRVALSNEIEPDLYISIHVNWYSNEAVNGIETYYYPIASDIRGETFAKLVQDGLINEFAMNNRNARISDFQVIRDTNDPAILIETGFISNAIDREILTSWDYSNRFTQTVYHCIIDYYAQGVN